jgi:Fe-S oxidoreductase
MKEIKDEIIPLNIRAAYQRPCSSRLSTNMLHYVDEIFKLIGVESAEREFTGEKALCCGAAIRDQSREGRSELADHVQRKNILDMADAGAEICVFNCPHCFETLGEKVAQKGIKPIFISNLCRLALGEKPRDYGFHLPLEIRGEISLNHK